MHLYFLLLKIAALFNAKAKALVQGQARSVAYLRENAGNGSYIWFHVSSVGEFEQARPLIERLRSEQPQRKILLTFFSPSGYEMRNNYDKVDLVAYLPFATRRNAKSFLDAVKVERAVFVKYEFWPAYLKELKTRHIPTFSVASIFRPHQAFFRWYGKSYRQLLTLFTHLYVQDEDSKQLLKQYDIHNVTVVGDTRFDRVTAIAKEAKQIPLIEEFAQGCNRVIVAGSTWPKDEELLARYVEEHKDVKLILVPHEIHEEHLHQIFNIFQGRFVRFSEATHQNLITTRVILINTMGMLSSIYRYGQVGYIGGGFGVGIHNTLEAAVYGIPTIFGPNYQNFREAVGLVKVGAAFSVSSYKEFESQLENALLRHKELGVAAHAYVESEMGATERIYKALFRN